MAGLVADQYDRRKVVRVALIGQLAFLIPRSFLAMKGGPSLAVLYIVASGFAASRLLHARDECAAFRHGADALPRAIALGRLRGAWGHSGPVLGGYASRSRRARLWLCRRADGVTLPPRS
jgi:hypothetical protein